MPRIMAMSPIYLLFTASLVLCLEVPPAPTGEVYDLLPDPGLVIPEWKKPWTGPDIPLTFKLQTTTNFPEQVKVAPAVRDGSQFFVSWVTPKKIKSVSLGKVSYGADRKNLDRFSTCPHRTYSFALNTEGSYRSGPIFHCVIGPLEPSTLYFYHIEGSPKVFNFTSLPRPGSLPVSKPFKFGLMADVGQTINSSITMDHAAAADLDFILFPGDLSYADNYKAPGCNKFTGPGTDRGSKTCGEGGARWDSFGRLAQKLFSRVPAVFCPGNHENELNVRWGELEQFRAYRARVPSLVDDKLKYGSYAKYIDVDSLPMKGYPAHSPIFYSLDIGLVHVIALSAYSAFTRYTPQDFFLRDDLCGIDRNVTPWVVVMIHAPWYNSDISHYLEGEPFRAIYEPYLFQAGVDLIIAGHVHAYERSHPVFDMRYNECGPVYVTVGDGGNDEGIAGPFLEPQPIYTAYREESFGYAELEVFNEREAQYTWFRNQNSTRVAGDSFSLENKFHKCGPKKPSFCPGGSRKE